MRAALVLVCSLAAACHSHAKSGSSSSGASGSPNPGGASTTTTTTTTSSGGGGESRPSPPPPSNDCPSLQIKAADSVSQGTPLRVQAIATGGSPTYKWTVNAGKIASGQGTAAIQIDTKGLSGMSVTATVELGNIGAQCETPTASATALVGP